MKRVKTSVKQHLRELKTITGKISCFSKKTGPTKKNVFCIVVRFLNLINLTFQSRLNPRHPRSLTFKNLGLGFLTFLGNFPGIISKFKLGQLRQYRRLW